MNQQQQQKYQHNSNIDFAQSYYHPNHTASSQYRSSSLPTWEGDHLKTRTNTQESPAVSVSIAQIVQAKQLERRQHSLSNDSENPLLNKKIFLNMATRNPYPQLKLMSSQNSQQNYQNNSQSIQRSSAANDYEHKKIKLADFLQKMDVMNSNMKHIERHFIERVQELTRSYETECGYFAEFFESLVERLTELKRSALSEAKKQFELTLNQIEGKRSELKLFVTEISELSDDVSVNLQNILQHMQIKPFNDILSNYDQRVSEINATLDKFAATNNQTMHLCLPVKTVKQLHRFLDSQQEDKNSDAFYTHSSQVPIHTNATILAPKSTPITPQQIKDFKMNVLSEVICTLPDNNLCQSHQNSLEDSATIHRRRRSQSSYNNQDQEKLLQKQYQSSKLNTTVDSVNPTDYRLQQYAPISIQNENLIPNLNAINSTSIDSNIPKQINREYNSNNRSSNNISQISWNTSLKNSALNYHSTNSRHHSISTLLPQQQAISSNNINHTSNEENKGASRKKSVSVYHQILNERNPGTGKQLQQYLSQQQSHTTSVMSNSHMDSMQTEFNDFNSHNISLS